MKGPEEQDSTRQSSEVTGTSPVGPVRQSSSRGRPGSSESVRQLLEKGVEATGSRMLVFLAILLIAINLIGVWGILYSGREAQEEVLKDLQLQAVAGAKSLEAILASTRADLLFLSKSPPIAGIQQALEYSDPMARRWRRLDIEATLLLFLTSHPEVETITLISAGTAAVVAGRRDGAPVILPTQPEETTHSPGTLFMSRWDLAEPGSGSQMEAIVSTTQLLESADPTGEYRLVLHPSSEAAQEAEADQERSTVIVPVRDPDWSPPIDWVILRSELRTGLLASLGRLTGRFQMTLLVNVLLLLLASVLGILSVRQARRSIALEMENRQQAQIHELERQLMHSERLASIGRLTAGLAHEINNPLEGMSNYLTLLRDDLQNGQTENCLEFADKIKEGLTRAAGVTRRALTFAEPGRKPDTLIDLRQVVNETVQFVKGNRLFRQMEIAINENGFDRSIVGNPVTLGQAFLNLLLNSAEIQEGTGLLEINFAVEGDYALVTVADRGPGIDEEILPRIFEPFLSGRGSTGLGLSICRSIVEQHEGRIEAANREGGGAIFSIWIPLSDESSRKAEPAGRKQPVKT